MFVYPAIDDKEQWEDEADNNGFNSLSKYVYALVQEARAYRQHEMGGPRQAEQRIEKLETEVERLEQQLERERQGSGQVELDDIDFLQRFLTTNYKQLDQLLREIVESGVLNDVIRKRVEDELYFLAAQNEVQYKRGWGWKLADNENGR